MTFDSPQRQYYQAFTDISPLKMSIKPIFFRLASRDACGPVISSRRANYIGKNSRCRYISSGTGTLDNERLFGIAICVKEDGVVFAGKVGEVMVRANGLQVDGRTALVK